MRHACLVVLVLWACGNPTTSAPSGPGSAPALRGTTASPRGDACRAAAAELGTFLTTMDRDVKVIWVAGVKLALRDGLPSTEFHDAPLLRVKPDGTELNDERLEGAALAARLQKMHATIVAEMASGRVPRGIPQETPTFLHLLIDAAMPWSRVVEVVEMAAAAGFVRPSFTFARTPKVPPPRSVALDELERLLAGSENKASALAQHTSGVIAGCPGLIRAFGKVGASESDDRGGELAAAIAPALVECDCTVDLDKLRATMWGLLGVPHPTSQLRVTLDRSVTPIVLPARTPWRDAHGKLAPDATVWLGVAR